MPDKKDKGGIFGLGLLGSRERMERCRKTEDEEPELPLEKLPMKITVNRSKGGDYHSVLVWSRDHEEEIKRAIERAIKGIGFPGRVVVEVSY